MKKIKKICMVTTSDIRFDSRILNEAYSLSKKYDLTIISKGNKKTKIPKYPFKVKFVEPSKISLKQINVVVSLIKLIVKAFKENPQVFHAHDLDGLLCALLPALAKRKKLIYDSHELWTGLYNYDHLRGLQWLIPFLEKCAVKHVSHIITVNQSIARIIEKKYHTSVTVVMNVSPYKKYHKNKFLQKKYPGEILLLHIGTVIRGRGGEKMIDALKYLPNDISIVFLGSVDDKLFNYIKIKKIDNRVHFLPPVDPSDIVKVACSADLGLSLTENTSINFYLSLPNKLFQYISAELPILGSDFPEFKKVILGNKIGDVVKPQNPRAIAKKIAMILEPGMQKTYRKNLAGLALKKYNWRIEADKLLKIYSKLEESI